MCQPTNLSCSNLAGAGSWLKDSSAIRWPCSSLLAQFSCVQGTLWHTHLVSIARTLCLAYHLSTEKSMLLNMKLIASHFQIQIISYLHHPLHPLKESRCTVPPLGQEHGQLWLLSMRFSSSLYLLKCKAFWSSRLKCKFKMAMRVTPKICTS